MRFAQVATESNSCDLSNDSKRIVQRRIQDPAERFELKKHHSWGGRPLEAKQNNSSLIDDL